MPGPEEKTVRELMHRYVVRIDEGKTLADASKLLREHSVASVVITRDDGPVGILTERDIAHRFLVLDKRPSDVVVKTIMSSPIVVGTPEMTVSDALGRMQRLGIRHLPISEGGNIVGIISLRDVAGQLPMTGGPELDSEGAESVQWSESGICEKCGTPSEMLMMRFGGLLCPDCAFDA